MWQILRDTCSIRVKPRNFLVFLQYCFIFNSKAWHMFKPFSTRNTDKNKIWTHAQIGSCVVQNKQNISPLKKKNFFNVVLLLSSFCPPFSSCPSLALSTQTRSVSCPHLFASPGSIKRPRTLNTCLNPNWEPLCLGRWHFYQHKSEKLKHAEMRPFDDDRPVVAPCFI